MALALPDKKNTFTSKNNCLDSIVATFENPLNLGRTRNYRKSTGEPETVDKAILVEVKPKEDKRCAQLLATTEIFCCPGGFN